MRRRSRPYARAFAALALLLAAMVDLATNRTSYAAPSAADGYVLTSSNQLARILDASGGLLAPALAVTGLAAGEELVAIAVRPQNNRLYGLTSNGAGAVRLYHIDGGSGAPIATPLSAAPVQFSDGTNPVAIGGTAFDINFNPTVDRVRAISNTGLNFRMNPNNGAIVDAAPATPGVNPDGALNGGSTTADATAYTNSFVNAATTSQYTLDSTTDSLFLQNPPNNGTLTSGVKVTLNGTPLDFSAAALDIPASVVVTTTNALATGTAYAVLRVNNSDSLYTLDLATGAATLAGTLGDLAVTDIALAPTIPVGMTMSSDGVTLHRFRLDQPGTVVSTAITGVDANETLVGFDGRPATGQLIGVGVNAAANTATLYVIDPQTAVATAIGAVGGIAYVDAAGTAIDLPPASAGYGVDFNPTVDRVRVTTDTGLNLRMNPVTGGAVDGDTTAAGTNPDGAISGQATGASATAYTNSFTGATVTTQYTLDSTTNRLLIQNPPNNGVQTSPITITLQGAPLDFSAANGFDIPTSVKSASANAPVRSGSAYAALTVGGSTSLYKIDLTNGDAQLRGPIGPGTAAMSGLVAWTPATSGLAYQLFMPLITGR